MYTPVPFGGIGGSPGQHTPKVPLLDPDTGSQVFEDDHGRGDIVEPGGSSGKGCNSRTIIDFRGEEPIFCWVRACRYWHTDPRQVMASKHPLRTSLRFCMSEPSHLPQPGGDFRRPDAVGVHCKKYLPCGDALKANGGRIHHWGTLATEGDLQPYDPNFHIPYERFDGRTGRSGGKVARTCR